MLTTYKWTQGAGLADAKGVIEPGMWVNLTEPTSAELDKVQSRFHLPPEYLTDPLDKDERARAEFDEDMNCSLVVLRVPIEDEGDDVVPYTTIPFGIVITPDSVITVCAQDTPLTNEFRQMRRICPPYVRYRFVFNLLLRAAIIYMRCLREIRDEASNIERSLHHAIENGSLVDFIDLQKSLVYFTTSLNADEIMLSRLGNMRQLGLNEDDRDLLDDVAIEYRQAYEMAKTHSDILTGTMESFASVISNNLNVVMKTLTSITIILMLPTLVASVYGMNIDLPFMHNPHAFEITMGFAVVISIIGVVFLRLRRLL